MGFLTLTSFEMFILVKPTQCQNPSLNTENVRVFDWHIDNSVSTYKFVILH